MPYWMINPDHGTMPVYDTGAVEQAKKHGWTLLNIGESPEYKPEAPEEILEQVRQSIAAVSSPRRHKKA